MAVRGEGPLKACEKFAEKVMELQTEARRAVVKMQANKHELTDYARTEYVSNYQNCHLVACDMCASDL